MAKLITEASVEELEAEILRRKEDEVTKRLALQQKWVTEVTAQVEVMRAELRKYNSMVNEARLNNAYIFAEHFADFVQELFEAGFLREPDDNDNWQSSSYRC